MKLVNTDFMRDGGISRADVITYYDSSSIELADLAAKVVHEAPQGAQLLVYGYGMTEEANAYFPGLDLVADHVEGAPNVHIYQVNRSEASTAEQAEFRAALVPSAANQVQHEAAAQIEFQFQPIRTRRRQGPQVHEARRVIARRRQSIANACLAQQPTPAIQTRRADPFVTAERRYRHRALFEAPE
jgi:hypothetical protein